MRTIKFRGKDIKTGEWVMGDLHLLCDKPHIHTAKSSYPFAGQRSFVVPETIGQFTGLYDENGKEIYEGDIIDFTNVDYPDCEIIFDNGSFVCNEIGEDNIICELRLSLVNEVIGNIHDNPELIK